MKRVTPSFVRLVGKLDFGNSDVSMGWMGESRHSAHPYYGETAGVNFVFLFE